MRRIKKEEAQEGEIVESFWDMRKIAVAGAVLLISAGAVFFALKVIGRSVNSSNVLGAESKNEQKTVPPLPSKEDVSNIISNAKDTLSQITSDNLTSSQAAIQKIIADLQSLQGKSGAVGVFCNLVCHDK